jgi:hypothetical protein
MSEHTQHLYAAALLARNMDTNDAGFAVILFISANDTDAHKHAIQQAYASFPPTEGYAYHNVRVIQAPDHMVNLD